MNNELLYLIEKNSQINITDLADMLNEEESVIKDKLSDLEKEKIICGYHTLINWDKTNVDKVTALIEVDVTPEKDNGYDSIAESIYQYKEVTSMYLMSGGYDFTVIVEGKTMHEVAMFVGQKLAPTAGVHGTATHFVLKRYKEFGVRFEESNDTQERRLFTP